MTHTSISYHFLRGNSKSQQDRDHNPPWQILQNHWSKENLNLKKMMDGRPKEPCPSIGALTMGIQWDLINKNWDLTLKYKINSGRWIVFTIQ
jgi:hypothetical protein